MNQRKFFNYISVSWKYGYIFNPLVSKMSRKCWGDSNIIRRKYPCFMCINNNPLSDNLRLAKYFNRLF